MFKEIFFDEPIKVINVNGKMVYFKGFYQLIEEFDEYKKLPYNNEFLDKITVEAIFSDNTIYADCGFNFNAFVKNGNDVEEVKNEILYILQHYVHYYEDENYIVASFFDAVSPKYQAFTNSLISGDWFKYNKRRYNN